MSRGTVVLALSFALMSAGCLVLPRSLVTNTAPVGGKTYAPLRDDAPVAVYLHPKALRNPSLEHNPILGNPPVVGSVRGTVLIGVGEYRLPGGRQHQGDFYWVRGGGSTVHKLELAARRRGADVVIITWGTNDHGSFELYRKVR